MDFALGERRRAPLFAKEEGPEPGGMGLDGVGKRVQFLASLLDTESFPGREGGGRRRDRGLEFGGAAVGGRGVGKARRGV